MNSKRGLGRGLDALLSNSSLSRERELQKNAVVEKKEVSNFIEIHIEKLQPGKYQPRKEISADALKELMLSIKAQGIIQPIIVRAISHSDKYEIIAGERRWRAASLADFKTVPCIVRKSSDKDTMSMALIENIQREDLNVIEEAQALAKLIQKFSYTHQDIAKIVGKSRAAISNLVRLNNLNNDVKNLVIDEKLDMGHARAILALDLEKQPQIAKQVVAKELSVRETEDLVKQSLTLKDKSLNNKKESKVIPKDIVNYVDQLENRLETKINIIQSKKEQGKLVINYKNIVELSRILSKL